MRSGILQRCLYVWWSMEHTGQKAPGVWCSRAHQQRTIVPVRSGGRQAEQESDQPG